MYKARFHKAIVMVALFSTVGSIPFAASAQRAIATEAGAMMPSPSMPASRIAASYTVEQRTAIADRLRSMSLNDLADTAKRDAAINDPRLSAALNKEIGATGGATARINWRKVIHIVAQFIADITA